VVTQDGDRVCLRALPQEEGVPVTRVRLDRQNSFAAISPDGALVIPTGLSYSRLLRTTRAYRVATGEPAGPPIRPGGQIVDAAFSPDGQSAATLTTRDGPSKDGQEVVVWDWKGGSKRWGVALPSEPRGLSYRPDGHRLAVLCAGGELVTFDPADGREVLRWPSHEPERFASHWVNNGRVRYSPDGQSLLIWGMGNDARVWEADTGRLRYPALRFKDKCHDLQFSPDGRSVALASYDHSVRVHEFETGTVLAELPAHPDMVYSAGFSPDGRLLVTASRDHTVRVWDWQVGRLACPSFEHAKDAVAAAFTPDGRWVLSVSDDGIARAWDWRTGKPATPPLAVQDGSWSLAVTPDGRYAVTGGELGALTILDLGELARADDDPDDLCLWAELLAGQQIHEGGGTVNLTAAEWLDRWRAFARRGQGSGKSD
jgi:WD40 repeat protein